MPNPLTESFRSPAALARFFAVALAGAGVDLWTKALAASNLSDDRNVGVIPGWLELTYQQNHGAVFGLGQGRLTLFVAVSIGAIIFLIYLFGISGRRAWYQVILGMLLAGVMGNLYDRLEYGYVRDMIHALPMWPHFFPWIFNVADSLLCTGVGLMMLYSFFTPQPPRESAAHPA